MDDDSLEIAGDTFWLVILIGTALTKLKSVGVPRVHEVLREMVRAWKNDLRDEGQGLFGNLVGLTYGPNLPRRLVPSSV